MTEFLTLNQMHVTPSQIVLKIRFWFWIVVMCVLLFYLLTRFVQWVIDDFCTVNALDYLEDSEGEGREEAG